MNRLKLILISVCLIGLVSSCSDDPRARIRYQAEKMFFKAEREALRTKIRPSLNTIDLLQKVESGYINTVEFCFDALKITKTGSPDKVVAELSEITFRAVTRLSQIQFARLFQPLAHFLWQKL